MPAVSTFTFDYFVLRPALRSDLETADAWNYADSAHRNGDPAFWLEQGPNVESYVLEDTFGPVFFFKMERRNASEIELHVQFPPMGETVLAQAMLRHRVMKGLIHGFKWLEKVLSFRKMTRLIFTSTNPYLIKFCERRLGFVCEGNHLTKELRPMQEQ
jgi:hypothetical protein